MGKNTVPQHTQSIAMAGFLGLVIGLFSLFVIILTAHDIGWTWDEVYYFKSSELIIAWGRALGTALLHGTPGAILSRTITDQYWLWDIAHNPHPPLARILTGISLAFLKGYCGELVAYRCAPAFLSTVLLLAVFFILNSRYGKLAGLCGSMSLLFLPRFFGHAHIGATEIPLAAFWFLACWSFWRGLTTISGTLLLGLFWGCAIATKFTGLLIPVPLLAWALLYRQKQALSTILIALPIALLIPVLINPGWWHDPVAKIALFLQDSLSRKDTIPISTFFWGKMYSFRPPWSYAFIMTAITIPITTLFAFALGVVNMFRDSARRPFNSLFFLNCLFPLILTLLPNAPVHDGIRQFFYMLPFMAYFCGIGFYYLNERIIATMRSAVMRRMATAAVVMALTLYPAYQTFRIHPYELCYYNELIGGVRGAYERGMETTYWFDVVNPEFLAAINKKIPHRALVNMWVPNKAYFEFLQEKGKIRKDIRFIAPDITMTLTNKNTTLKFSTETPEYLILLSRQGSFNALFRNIYRNNRPLYTLVYEGVPLISLYRW